MGLADNTQNPYAGSGSWFTDSPLADLAAIIAASGAATGLGFNIAQAAGGMGGTGGNPKFARVPGTAYQQALSKYGARLVAQNAGARPPSFQEFLQSGGTARFPLTGVGQFTPQEAVQLGLVSGSRRRPDIPYYTPGSGRLTPEQLVFLRHQRRRRRKANELQPSGGGGGKKKDEDPVTITVGTNSGDWGEK